MSVKFSQLRHDERQEVLAFCREHQSRGEGQDICMVRIPKHLCNLSMIAYDADRVVGAAVCVDTSAGLTLHVVTDASQGTLDLARSMVDKAVPKVKAQGANKCRIKLGDAAIDDAFWEQVTWTMLDTTVRSRPGRSPQDSPPVQRADPPTGVVPAPEAAALVSKPVDDPEMGVAE